jgi:hypothetical protein
MLPMQADASVAVSSPMRGVARLMTGAYRNDHAPPPPRPELNDPEQLQGQLAAVSPCLV